MIGKNGKSVFRIIFAVGID